MLAVLTVGFGSVGTIAAPAASTRATTSSIDATVERTAPDQLTISWSAPPGRAVTAVRWGDQPSDATTPLLDEVEQTTREVVVQDPSPGSRVYFALVSRGGDRTIVAERRLPLEGDPNFRDLGGYKTSDGRTVKWGRIYRSGSLDALTDADLAYLEGLGIKLVCDLRAPSEITIEPDRLPAGVEAVNIPLVDDSVDPVAIREAVLAGDVSDLGKPGELLIEGNRKFVTDFSDELSTMMTRVTDPRAQPAILHCSAGKDRAGLAAALVLLTLGVPQKTVMQDYLLSNDYRAEENERTLVSLRALLDPSEVEVIQALLEVRPEYLQAAFAAMKKKYGSIDAYLKNGLGITDEQRARFQRQMLEAAS